MAFFRRREGSDTFNLNLTPLLDVVLQLITFFMMLIHFGSRLEGSTKSVRLPVAPAALPGSDLGFDRLVVGVDRSGRLITDDDETVEGNAAQQWWVEQARSRQAGQETLGGATEELPTIVVIRADKDAAYGTIRRILAEAQERGFAHFSLVVLRSRPK